MKIKTKLHLGFGFLFVVVLFFGAVSLFYLNQISGSAKVILKDNYESLSFAHQMRKILDDNPIPLSPNASADFNRYLKLEENNLTETGEKEAVSVLYKAYLSLSKVNLIALQQVHDQLRKIEELNMDAIVKKNAAAQNSVKNGTVYLSFAACITFLVLFSFSVNFPGFIADPLGELSQGILEISRQNYNKRLEFNSNDEFSELANAFNEMAAKLNEWENTNIATLKSEKLRIEAIIEQMQDAIIGLNEKQEILFINAAAEKVLSLQDSMIGKSALDFLAENNLLKILIDNRELDKQLKIYIDDKDSYFQMDSREIIVPSYEKQEDEVLINSGKSVGKVYILRNITRFKELDTAKTNFIATVSHELKTPIASIKMCTKLLMDKRIGSINNEQYQLVQNISEDSERLLKITSELLHLTKVETGDLKLQFSPTDPNIIVNYAIESLKFQAQQKRVRLELVTKQPLPNVMADTEKTAWVLINFLSNALRYSPEESEILIGVKDTGHYIEFSVEDYGKGIDENYQKCIFDRYFQVPADGRNKAGSGLGLAISKDFIEAAKGHIWVESVIDKGSKFYFTLPKA